jgi:hypothetical protein
VLSVRHPQRDRAQVFFARTDDSGATRVFSASVVRGEDGILRPDSEPIEHPGLWEEIDADSERRPPGV